MQTNNRIFDDLAKVANGAMSIATGMRQEMEQLIRQQLERFLNDRDLVTREEFEAVKAMAVKAREEQEVMAARLAALEAGLAAGEVGASKAGAAKPAAKKAASARAAKPKPAAGSDKKSDTAPR
jgi:BMFP domain-containing protein YqiC